MSKVFVVSGKGGSGKTLFAMSYRPQGYAPDKTPRRFIVDMDFMRSKEYNALEKGSNVDDPGQLLFAATSAKIENNAITAPWLKGLLKSVTNLDKPFEYDVFIIDGFPAFYDQLRTILANARFAGEVADLLKIRFPKWVSFLKFYSAEKPAFSKFVKDVMDALIGALRNRDVDVILVTENKNQWSKFGTSDAAIVAQTANMPDNVQYRADLYLVLERFALEGEGRNVKAVVRPKPIVTIDPVYAKAAIVGWPTKFTFESWEKVWALVKERKVPTQADFDVLAYTVDFENSDEDTKTNLMAYVLGALVEYLGEVREVAEPELHSILGRLKLQLTAENVEEVIAKVTEYCKTAKLQP